VDLHRRVLDAVARQGVRVTAVLREEHGVLPLPWSADDREAPDRSPLRLGYRGGWFHPVTGYSFPCAIRLATAAAQAASVAGFLAEVVRLRREHRSQVRFGRLLNRLMFTGVAPEERWRLLARFYTLPAGTIERFYALRTTMADRVRVFAGRPPRGLSLRGVLASRRPS
jgi:lycopene beta-cyclase